MMTALPEKYYSGHHNNHRKKIAQKPGKKHGENVQTSGFKYS